MNIKIGNTPMIKINYTLEGEEGSVFVKLEQYNITGSIKDRVAFYIIKKASLAKAYSLAASTALLNPPSSLEIKVTLAPYILIRSNLSLLTQFGINM